MKNKQIKAIVVDKIENIDLTNIHAIYRVGDGYYFIRNTNAYEYISKEFFEYTKSLVKEMNEDNNSDFTYKETTFTNNDIESINNYSDILIKLSGKYTAEDIIKFKKEGMI